MAIKTEIVLRFSWTLCPINLSVVSTSTWNRFVTMKKDNSSVIEYGGGYQYPDEFAKNRPNREELLIEFAQRMNWHFKKLNIKNIRIHLQGCIQQRGPAGL